MNGLSAQNTLTFLNLKNAPKHFVIGLQALLILFLPLLPTVLPRAAITKLRFLSVMLMDILTLFVLESAFYIYFLIKKYKQSSKGNCLHSITLIRYNKLRKLKNGIKSRHSLQVSGRMKLLHKHSKGESKLCLTTLYNLTRKLSRGK